MKLGKNETEEEKTGREHFKIVVGLGQYDICILRLILHINKITEVGFVNKRMTSYNSERHGLCVCLQSHF